MEGEIMFRAIAQRFPMMTLAHDRTHWRDTPVFRGARSPPGPPEQNQTLSFTAAPIPSATGVTCRSGTSHVDLNPMRGKAYEPAQSLQLNKHSQTTNCPFGKSNTPTLLPLERRAP